MKITWKWLLVSAALAAVFFYIGKGIGGASEARQLSEADYESAPSGAPASAPDMGSEATSAASASVPDAVSEATAAESVSIPEAISEAISAVSKVIGSWQAGVESPPGRYAGFSFDKGTTRVPLPAGTESVSIENTNGNIEIKQGTGTEIEIHTTVVVDQATAKEAQVIADKTGIKVSGAANLEIKSYSAPYRNFHYPSLELTVTLPQGMKADLQADTENGNLSLSKVSSAGKIKLSSVNGNVTATGSPQGISLHTVNGNVHVSEAKADVEVSLTNGNVKAEQIAGALEVETTNGNLRIKDAHAAVEAVTVAGNIHVESQKVGGNWKITSRGGDVELAWPENAGVMVDAKSPFGEIQTNFPLMVKNHKASGKIGAGTYLIHAQSMAGISLMKKS
ncbi:DUF4097 family beta strand repeat-containing protein [Paenibacillus sonchi]|uniref:DUF4097 family beta strand repeat-containing protein n=1 Tax=Paenibacillus sonchi TaxID=373687 RepID=UPI001E577E8A|nr:DUF4097 family beta strand repeat-containing protein [Paenibacillus sonchi]MCE3203995.1 DUF4097 domain-containing protein [Paenibacillus sonchi]